MLDHWCDAREAAGRETLGEAGERARQILASIADDEYVRLAGDGASGTEVFRSAERGIEEFQVVTGESL